MECSIVKYSEIDENLFRLDSEHHVGIQKIDLVRLKGTKLSNICSKVVQGPNPKFIKSGIPSLNGKNIYFGTLDAGEPNYISEEEFRSLGSYHLKKNDILITLKHATRVGRLWIYRKNKDCLFSRNLGLIRVKKSSAINAETLVLYLWGDTQQKLLNLIATGGTNGQITLSMAELREFPVPHFTDRFQTTIRDKFIESEYLIGKSNRTFKDAKNILLSELGLTNWQPKHQLTFIKNYSDTQQAGRIDAEYYQPKYDEIINAIKSYSGGWDSVATLLNIKDKNFTPEKSGVYQYIELSNIAGNGEVTGCTADFGSELPSRARRIVATGDVIVSSIEGSLSSIALIGEEYHQSLCSTGFYVVNSHFFNSESLLVLLKSVVGQMLLKKGCNGTILTAINKDEFRNIVLPKIDVKKQSEIQQKVTESFQLRKQSKQLLESAKKAVEMAIEQDEETAINWLKSEIENVGVTDANRL